MSRAMAHPGDTGPEVQTAGSQEVPTMGAAIIKVRQVVQRILNAEEVRSSALALLAAVAMKACDTLAHGRKTPVGPRPTHVTKSRMD
jgi:hypothetical protein